MEAGCCGTYVLADSKLNGLSEIIQPKVNGEMLNIENVPHAEFSIKDIVNTPYDTQHMQPILFCANSYEQLKEETCNWLEKINQY